MLLMVIEQFKNGDAQAVRERFQQKGRMLPDNVEYISSWIDPARARCFQIMQAREADALKPWIANWSDLVDFEIVPVLQSQDYWERFANRPVES
jgi:Protein of unknown function (DUF3303)